MFRRTPLKVVIYVIGLVGCMLYLAKGNQVLAGAALIAAGTIGDIRFTRG